VAEDLFSPAPGTISFSSSTSEGPKAGLWSIVIPLESFSADDEYSKDWRPGSAGPEMISTKVVLEFIRLPTDDVRDLVRRSFEFPVNPAAGYIDGSVYIAAKHNPVNVRQVRFGDLVDGRIAVTIVGEIVFEFELWGVPNRPIELSTALRVDDSN
jgi:hypothetical protein